MPRIEVRPELRYAWHGPSMLVTTPRAECGGDLPLTGFWFREARHLQTLRLEIDGHRPWLSESAAVSAQRLHVAFIHPELVRFAGGGSGWAAGPSGDAGRHASGLPFRALDLRLDVTVEIAALQLTLSVANRTRDELEFELAWVLDADFADLLQVNGEGESAVAPRRSDHRADELRFIRNDDALPLETRIHGLGAHRWTVRDERLTIRLRLARSQQVVLPLRVEPVDPTRPLTDVHEREECWRQWSDALTEIRARGEPAIDRVVRQSVADLASFPLLEGSPAEWLAPQAGVPLYPALFGRDAVTASWQSAMLDRGDMLDAVLTRLGREQGTKDDPRHAEQPGRILQQARTGPLSRLGVLPYSGYYGDFASPLMFVIGLAHLYAWTGDRSRLTAHWDAARRVLDWARERGDRDGDGFLEYPGDASIGPVNEGWKDSGDAIVDDDGTAVHGPLGTCELQGYWFAAQQLMAVLSWVQGARQDAGAWWRSANDLRTRFNRDFWMEDEGFIGLALDAEKRLIRAPTSNVGHCIAAGIVSDDRLPRVVGRLFEPDLFSGWGVRTLSSRHAAYDPISYHRGSVWAVENATIVFGLRRFGFSARALELTRALFDLAEMYVDARIPEAVGGYSRSEWATPGAYPRANSPQLWNASVFPLVVHTMLGLQPVAPLDLLVVDPILPTWLPEVVLRDLRLGGATATIRFWRDGSGQSHAEILHKRGTLHLIRQPPPEALNVRIRDRFSALADRILHH